MSYPLFQSVPAPVFCKSQGIVLKFNITISAKVLFEQMQVSVVATEIVSLLYGQLIKVLWGFIFLIVSPQQTTVNYN